ncbi:MAG: phosphoribosylamine--glycine ligase [Chloroflexi bacterium]|nr:phosphoribosylamine--glycine ligase [Chloroflexota bacterium]
MKVLVIGSGSREHAIAWRLSQSPRVDKLLVAPGNAGTAAIATNLAVAATDIAALAQAVRDNGVDLTIVGPEIPLAEGIVDRFQELGLRIFGPTKAAAQIEASKGFAKELMRRHGIPSADGLTFDTYTEAVRFIERHDAPLVVKADGLAAGKGVTVAATREEALAALRSSMVERTFGAAGDRVVIEEYLEGREVSVFVFTDGEALSPVVAACDYKRVYDGDQGPNTGGMGSYSPPEFWEPSLTKEIEQRILQPTVQAMAQDGRAYRGVLYGGLIMTRQGPKVIEFNCRLGDPETQVIMPLLKTDLVDIVESVLEGNLTETPIQWSPEACVGVVIAAGGYPGEYQKGIAITGLNDVPEDIEVFHAGTKTSANKGDSSPEVITDGGRVLTVVGRGPSLAVARERVYAAAQGITFSGSFYRTDIALRPGDITMAGR